jgi:predicted DNA-binding protein (MmcQ/YjbR family)
MRARRLCLGLGETSEASSHGHPVFRVDTKMFCAFEMHHGRPSIAVRVPVSECESQVGEGLMFATPYGRGAWTSAWVDGEVDWTELAALIRRAWEDVANTRRRPGQ